MEHTAEYFEDKYLGIASYVLESKSNKLTSQEKMALQTFTELNMSKGQLSHFESALSKHDCFKLKNPNIVGNHLNEVPHITHKPDWFTLDCSQKNTKDIKKAQKKMRKKLNILMNEDKPVGGKWSFDEENRKKLPKGLSVPKIPKIKDSIYKEEIKNIILENFSNHPGELDGVNIPCTRKEAKKWLKSFLEERFTLFGDYEDAIDTNETFLFHSLLSPLLTIGLITPDEVIDQSLSYAKKNKIPLNSLEGFIRQIIGWREFIKGVYDLKGVDQENSNYFNHSKKLKDCWYEGSTGIDPLDKAIKESIDHGYTHHINRLMVIANIMNLAGVSPKEIYTWFMEMYLDSSEWVMVPNVFGMSTYADAGIMSTKPYICGSNYLLKMSNFKRGDWCEIVDGLYWSFISKHSEFFRSNPRLSLMTRSLDKMNKDKKERIFKIAEDFISSTTY